MPFSPQSLRPDPRPETMAELRKLLPPFLADAAVEAAVAEYAEDRRRGEVKTARRSPRQEIGSRQRNMSRNRSASASFLDRSQHDDD